MRAANLVIGADSKLGSTLLTALRDAEPDTLATTRRPNPERRGLLELDLAREDSFKNLPDNLGAVYICAAVSSMIRCEDEPQYSDSVNRHGVIGLATLACQRGGFPVFLSTNHVFDGATPYASEDAATCPVCAYGRQKAAVEQHFTAELSGRSAVLRVTKVVVAGQEPFHSWIDKLRARQHVRALEDLRFAPVTLAAVTAMLLRIGIERRAGIHHLSGAADISYWDAARFLAAQIGADENLIAATNSRAEGVRLAAAPLNTALDMRTTAATFGIAAPSAEEVLMELFLRP